MPLTPAPLALRPVVVVMLAVLLGGLALAGCPKPVDANAGCRSDLDCGQNQSCNVATGRCLCIDDNACDVSEFCNLAGGCQAKLECFNNTDCDGNVGTICDTTSGECLALTASLQCVLDSQCPYGSHCDNQQCQIGCRDDGDCTLGTPCIANTCDETPGACNSNNFCEFGQLCQANRCVDHVARDQLCADCGPSDPFRCSTDCLIDSSVRPDPCTADTDCDKGECLASQCLEDSDCNGGTCEDAFPAFGLPGQCSNKICQGFFCGADGCDDVTAPCPRGYTCFVLQIVSGTQCQLGGAPGQCGANRACNGGGENGAVGFCSCASDEDCPPGNDATCTNPGPTGSCVVGTTCGPSDGLLCEDVR